MFLLRAKDTLSQRPHLFFFFFFARRLGMGLSLARAQRAPEQWAPSFHVAMGGMETTPHPTSPRSRLLWTWTCPSNFSSPLHHLLQPRVKPTIKGSGELLASSLPWRLRWVRTIPWRSKWQPIPVFFAGKSHGQRSLAGYNPWGCKQSGMTEQLNNNHPIKLHSWLSSTLLDGLSYNSLLDSDFVRLSPQER